MFYSFNGKQYSCNPRYISEYIEENYPGKFEIIWAFKKADTFKDILPKNVKSVKYRSIFYYYYAKTSRVIVQNVGGFGEFKRRKNQDIIQTWHASNGYKKGSLKSNVGIERKLELICHRDYTYVLCGSKNMLEKCIRGTMGFDGPIIKGTPRMDILINQNHPEYKNI